MRLENNVDKQITTYPSLYWDVDRPHARRRVLDEMFLSGNSSFVWTQDGYLLNTDLVTSSPEHAPDYGKLTHDVFVDWAWLDINKGKQRRGAWAPTPVSEECNLAKIPDNVRPDYLEGAYEIAKEALAYLKIAENDPDSYCVMITPEQIERQVVMILQDKDDDYDVPYPYHRAHEENILTLEWAQNHERQRGVSKIRRMTYVLEDFLERYDALKKTQAPITVYLDDNRPTPDEFDAHIYNTEQVKTMLMYENVRLVSLDNDLGVYSPQEGYKVAQFIEEKAFHGELVRTQVNVHSANTVAHQEMVRAIAQANKFWDKHE